MIVDLAYLREPCSCQASRVCESYTRARHNCLLNLYTCNALRTLIRTKRLAERYPLFVPVVLAALGNRFQTWRGMARLQAGIIWEDGSQQFFGILQTHKAGLCGKERHIFPLNPQEMDSS